MTNRNRYIILMALLCYSTTMQAQDLTGTWEGMMGRRFSGVDNRQYLQLNIVQRNNEICGYTFDSVLDTKNDRCKALFTGTYDKKRKEWELTGTYFMENSGTHVFMRIKIWKEKHTAEDMLEAEVSRKSDPDPASFFDGMEILTPYGIIRRPVSTTESLRLKRVSHDPPQLPDSIPSCFPGWEKPKEPVATKTLPLDTAAIARIDSAELIQKLKTRKNTTLYRLPVDVKNITLDLYDNAIVDGDTISVFYNGKLMVSKQRLSEKPITINLVLDEKAPQHEILLFAHNLGSIPPNTALIVVTAGTKRFELFSSASLEENAVLIFEYGVK